MNEEFERRSEKNSNTNWFRLEDVAAIFNWNTTSERFVNVVNCRTCCWRAAAAAALPPNLSINNNAMKWINQWNMLPPSALHVLLWIKFAAQHFYRWKQKTIDRTERTERKNCKSTKCRRRFSVFFKCRAHDYHNYHLYLFHFVFPCLFISVCRSVCVRAAAKSNT